MAKQIKMKASSDSISRYSPTELKVKDPGSLGEIET